MAPSLWASVACSTKPAGENAEASATAHIFGSEQVTLPAGTVVTVRLVTAVGSKLSTTGEHFSATVARPVEVDGKVVVPPGTEALGKIVEAVPQGRFKGAAVLRLVLETVTVKNDSYDVKTSSVSRYLKGKGKRTATLIGGGAKTSECFRVQNELHVRSVRPSDLAPTNALTVTDQFVAKSRLPVTYLAVMRGIRASVGSKRPAA